MGEKCSNNSECPRRRNVAQVDKRKEKMWGWEMVGKWKKRRAIVHHYNRSHYLPWAAAQSQLNADKERWVG